MRARRTWDEARAAGGRASAGHLPPARPVRVECPKRDLVAGPVVELRGPWAPRAWRWPARSLGNVWGALVTVDIICLIILSVFRIKLLPDVTLRPAVAVSAPVRHIVPCRLAGELRRQTARILSRKPVAVGSTRWLGVNACLRYLLGETTLAVFENGVAKGSRIRVDELIQFLVS
jgi:hypothetical protein